MSDKINRSAGNLKLKYFKTRKLTTETFGQLIDLILATRVAPAVNTQTTGNIPVAGAPDITAQNVRDLLETLVGPARLRASAIKDLDFDAGMAQMTALEIRDSLQTLLGPARLSAYAIRDLSARNVTVTVDPSLALPTVQDVVVYLLDALSQHELNLGLPETDGYVLASTVLGARSWVKMESDANFIHVQDTTSLVWEFTHTLGKIPSVITLNANGHEVKGQVEQVNHSNVKIKWNIAQSGLAILN